MTRSPVHRLGARHGLTLLELLAVLMILAITTTIAVVSVQGVQDQSRYDATKRTLTAVEEAIFGQQDQRQPDGTPLLSGFVTDVGRGPKLHGDVPETQLAELYDASLWSAFPFGLRPGPAGYEDMRLPCGYRGPYLDLGVGASELLDGWGNAFELHPGTDGSLLESLTWNAVDPYTEDLFLDAGRGLVSVVGTVTNDGAAPASATVVLLHPDPEVSTTTLAVATDLNSQEPGAFRFDNVPIGLRAIRAVIDGHVVTRYVYVPRTGLALTLNYVPDTGG